MARKGTNYTSQKAFLTAYAACGKIVEAHRAAKLPHNQHWKWYKADEEYRKFFDEAQEAVIQKLEDEAIRRAHDGVKRPVMYKGQPVKLSGRRILYETEYSDQLLICLLKRFRPQLYRENQTVEHTGSVELIDRMQAARKRIFELRKTENAGTA